VSSSSGGTNSLAPRASVLAGTPGGSGRSPEGDAPRSEAAALGARRLLPARPQPPNFVTRHVTTLNMPQGRVTVGRIGNPSHGFKIKDRGRQGTAAPSHS